MKQKLRDTKEQLGDTNQAIARHDGLLNADSDRWLNMRYRTFLSWTREHQQSNSAQKKKIAKFNVLIHGADIGTDARMFEEKRLECFDLFSNLYRCSVAVARRLSKIDLSSIQIAGIPLKHTRARSIDIHPSSLDLAGRKLLRKLKKQSTSRSGVHSPQVPPPRDRPRDPHTRDGDCDIERHLSGLPCC
ncbi:hypothetical protein ASPVEDRAFT_30882 [Aspergillus versicolor CBS 583.65]|uniref:Uncharacterized protein n=1 Tax=Aspergillus versicolor CBS 583.65 TaxID=1036611 RepID=A0A1L9PSB8_ASPVE|nr:uncharacterized protein ASPVEDRAFT_30882 [Aspergillus versicolor CBS 583.65]OJJ04424.1 hypothetical protein ASPVEDRAFT_30882 [Aspergillus versicolor CBS 583.65]